MAGHAGALRGVARFLEEFVVQLDAERSGAGAACHDRNAPITRAEIDHEIARADTREIEHARDGFLRRWLIDDVGPLCWGRG